MENELSTFVTVFFLILLVIAIFIIWYGVRNAPKRKAWEENLQSLGFTKIKEAPQAVIQSVVSLYRCSSRRYRPDRFMLWDVYEKRDAQGGLYIFDLVDITNRSYRWWGAGMIAVVSPHLNLPYFSIAARTSSAGVANEVFRGIGESLNVFTSEYGSLKQLSLEEYPEIDQQLLVMVEDEFAARQLLTPQRLASLTWLASREHPGQIECGGDCLALRPLPAPTNGRPKADTQLMLQGMEQLWTIFSS